MLLSSLLMGLLFLFGLFTLIESSSPQQSHSVGNHVTNKSNQNNAFPIVGAESDVIMNFPTVAVPRAKRYTPGGEYPNNCSIHTLKWREEHVVFELEIGTPPRKYALKVDAFSNEIILRQNNPSGPRNRTINCYNPTESTSFKKSNQTINYQSGGEQGHFMWESMYESVTLQSCKLSNIPMVLSRNYIQCEGLIAVGIFGLNFRSSYGDNIMEYPQFYRAYPVQTGFNDASVSLRLYSKFQTIGALSIGCDLNENQTKKKIPLDIQDFPLMKIGITKREDVMTITTNGSAIAWFEGYAIMGPMEQVQELAKELKFTLDKNKEGAYTVKCNASFPKLYLTLGKEEFFLGPNDYLRRRSRNSTTCDWMIRGTRSPFSDTWFLGLSFLEVYSPTFSMDGQSIEFADTRKPLKFSWP
jgi:Eukaryotic aspartyl protease